MQGIQRFFYVREMQPDERVKKIMQVMARGYLTRGMNVSFVRKIGGQIGLSHKDERAAACRLEIMHTGDLICCLQPVATANQCLPCFPERCEPGSLPVNTIQPHDGSDKCPLQLAARVQRHHG